ncbi:MAG: hypothetical protein ACYDDF_12665 [Thermoplasmatota archaeon]
MASAGTYCNMTSPGHAAQGQNESAAFAGGFACVIGCGSAAVEWSQWGSPPQCATVIAAYADLSGGAWDDIGCPVGPPPPVPEVLP